MDKNNNKVIKAEFIHNKTLIMWQKIYLWKNTMYSPTLLENTTVKTLFLIKTWYIVFIKIFSFSKMMMIDTTKNLFDFYISISFFSLSSLQNEHII